MEELEELYRYLNIPTTPLEIAKKAIRKTEIDHPNYEYDHSHITSYIKRAIGEVKTSIKERIIEESKGFTE